MFKSCLKNMEKSGKFNYFKLVTQLRMVFILINNELAYWM